MNGLWPEGGGGVGPWVAFLALEGGAASPSGRVWWRGEGRTFQVEDTFVCLFVNIIIPDIATVYAVVGCVPASTVFLH